MERCQNRSAHGCYLLRSLLTCSISLILATAWSLIPGGAAHASTPTSQPFWSEDWVVVCIPPASAGRGASQRFVLIHRDSDKECYLLSTRNGNRGAASEALRQHRAVSRSVGQALGVDSRNVQVAPAYLIYSTEKAANVCPSGQEWIGQATTGISQSNNEFDEFNTQWATTTLSLETVPSWLKGDNQTIVYFDAFPLGNIDFALAHSQGWDWPAYAVNYVSPEVEASSSEHPDSARHGPFVASLGSLVAPAARAEFARVLNADGQGVITDLIKAMQLETQQAEGEPYIFNFSLELCGEAVEAAQEKMNLSGPEDATMALLHQVLTAAASQGITMVAASGNRGSEYTDWPAAHESVLSVGASTPANEQAAFSNHSAGGLLAPGVEMLGALGSGVGQGNGTSFATPLVSGISALLLQSNPSLTPSAIAQIVQNTAIGTTDHRVANAAQATCAVIHCQD